MYWQQLIASDLKEEDEEEEKDKDEAEDGMIRRVRRRRREEEKILWNWEGICRDRGEIEGVGMEGRLDHNIVYTFLAFSINKK